MEIQQLLLIAGTGRNTGKTTFACKIIRKFSSSHSIISLKITPHFHKNDQSGKVIIDETNTYISAETNSTTTKDSPLMLQSGAQQSFFVMAANQYLSEAFQKIVQKVPTDSFIGFESGGLRHRGVPGLFFMMNKTDGKMIKTDAEKTDFDIHSIEINDNRWKIKQ